MTTSGVAHEQRDRRRCAAGAAQREIDRRLVACQVAVARDGDVVWTETFGAADASSRFMVASATKPIVASAVWQLLADGSLELSRPVADYVPGFGENGKGAVTVEQVLLMTCGFPNAPMAPPKAWIPTSARAVRIVELEYEPGTQYAYHAASAHWVLAELLEHVTGDDFRDVIEQRVTRPLGLPRVLGIARAEQTASRSSRSHRWKASRYDRVEMIEAGVPGAGGVMTAATLARFYQALLHDPGGLWDPAVLADGTGNVRCTLPDPVMGMPANRTIGVVVGNGFGAVWGSSPTASDGRAWAARSASPSRPPGCRSRSCRAGDPDPQHAFVRAVKLSDARARPGRLTRVGTGVERRRGRRRRHRRARHHRDGQGLRPHVGRLRRRRGAAAVDDAGLGLADLDGLLVSVGVGGGLGIDLAARLGLHDLPLLSSVNSFGSTAAGAVQLVSFAIVAGHATRSRASSPTHPLTQSAPVPCTWAGRGRPATGAPRVGGRGAQQRAQHVRARGTTTHGGVRHERGPVRRRRGITARPGP